MRLCYYQITMPHIHEKIDFVVNIPIIYNNKVLLIHHKKLNRWLTIGGHIELNEDSDEALFREVKEECGLEIELISKKPSLESKGTKFLHAPEYMDIHEVSGNHKHIGMVYFAKAKSDAFIHNTEEHNDIRWFSEEDLDNLEFDLSPAIKFYAKEALKIVKQ